MKLTAEQRDDLLLAIACKLGVQLNESGNGENKERKSRKPFPGAIDHSQGVSIMAGISFPAELSTVAVALGITGRDLHKVRFAQGDKAMPNDKITSESAHAAWLAICTKRGY